MFWFLVGKGRIAISSPSPDGDVHWPSRCGDIVSNGSRPLVCVNVPSQDNVHMVLDHKGFKVFLCRKNLHIVMMQRERIINWGVNSK